MSGEVVFRPLAAWPYPNTRDRRGWRTFTAPWLNTLNLLRAELDKLRARDVIVAVCLTENEIRRDGYPKEQARPFHPGVEVSFTANALPNKPRIVYATDVCEDWQHNIRSIALGLGALRAVDRYGITRRGEQYAGFMALAAGGPDVEAGRRLVDEAGGIREALMKHHPDHGGDPRNFAHVQAFREKAEL